MLAGRGNIVARRKILENFDVGDQPRACENTFQQVVTENATVGNSAGKSGLEGVHVVDAFAAVRPLLEEILINIGNGRCVRVDAGWARENALINRAIPHGGKRWRHPRLQHTVAFDHAAANGIKFRPIERVRHFPDQALCGSNGKPRVRVQGDDVTDA